MPPPIPPPPKSYSPASIQQQTVDEDSSSSGHSAEPNDGFGVTMKSTREGAGVTPGLRRRRERAERQKTFIREQQEAAAAGLRPFDTKDDTHGKFFFNVSKQPKVVVLLFRFCFKLNHVLCLMFFFRYYHCKLTNRSNSHSCSCTFKE